MCEERKSTTVSRHPTPHSLKTCLAGFGWVMPTMSGVIRKGYAVVVVAKAPTTHAEPDI